MKDPCCLFYWGDWAGGTRTFTRHTKGAYMELLEAQFNSSNDALTIDEIKIVLGIDYEKEWPILSKKFIQLEDDTYRNERLLFEKMRRKKYTASRRGNLQAVIEVPVENVYRKFDHLVITNQEVDKLKALGYSIASINSILDRIENFKQNTKYKNLFLTAKNWLRNEPKDNTGRVRKTL